MTLQDPHMFIKLWCLGFASLHRHYTAINVVLQVLVYSGPESTADGARCKAALLAAHNMTLPVGPDGQHCTRIVYLVDPFR